MPIFARSEPESMRIVFTSAAFFISLFCLVPCELLIAESDTQDRQSQEALNVLLNEIWNWELAEDSWLATEAGVDVGQNTFPRVDLLNQKRRYDQRREYLKRLTQISSQSLPDTDRINLEVLRLRLIDDISAFEFQTFLAPLTGRTGYHLSFLELANTMKLEQLEDFENYIGRLNDFARYNDEQIDLMRLGIECGITTPAVVLRESAVQMEPHLISDPTKSELYRPFLASSPAGIDDAQWMRLRKEAHRALQENSIPSLRMLWQFLSEEYIPAARSTISARALPNGREFYRSQVAKHTTTNLGAQEIHQLGLNEVSRIKNEMREVIEQLQFDGSLDEFIETLRSDPIHYATTPEELMQYVALILKRIDGSLPQAFSTLPRTPYGLKEIPDFFAPQTTSAYYWPPAGDGSRAGNFYLNTYNLRQRPKYEMEALAMHEAVPGHHLQIALQQELTEVHPMRRFTMFTAYVEGWALYSEWLGQELGFYTDPYQNFGRLSMEAWRSCRLVVDTGIHDMGWTRQQAIQYMQSNTALSPHNIVAEVDRYIAWPAQALGYKIGQLKILELRQRAEKQLGKKFSLRRFHEVVLLQGAVPLNLLEEQVDKWLADEPK